MKGKVQIKLKGHVPLLVAATVLALGCYRQEMADQPRYEPLESSSFFRDGMASRPIPAGTVARDALAGGSEFVTGKRAGQFVRQMPMEIDLALVQRGRERYDIFCSPCHDRTGSGRGMAVLRGFSRLPSSVHIDRLREAPDGYFFDVITHGFASMNDYAAQIMPRDRWAIVAYIRALQLSRNATMEDVPPEQRNASAGWKHE